MANPSLPLTDLTDRDQEIIKIWRADKYEVYINIGLMREVSENF